MHRSVALLHEYGRVKVALHHVFAPTELCCLHSLTRVAHLA
jgi:hypothetical protein